jgi:gas vesicle protein
MEQTMTVLRQKTKAKKAALEANAAAADARRAAQESAAAVRDLAQALVAQVRQLGIEEKTSEAVERLKGTEAYHKAQAKADELGRRVAESDAVSTGRENASRRTAQALTGLGAWLATGERGKRLGISRSRRAGGIGWIMGVIGVGVGYAAGVLTAPKEGREIREKLISRGGDAFGSVAGRIGQDWDDTTPPFERPLADKVRTRLGEDPRTADLPSLNINVVNGTVVVRGSVPDNADQGAIADVISSVEGVDDVDIKLGTAI